jgi:lysophospholipase L1-like esterase
MSWEIFKNNVLQKLCDASRVSSIEYVADVYAKEYDACVKRGGDSINRIPILKGNVEGMKTAFIRALNTGLSSTSPYDLTGAMGDGVKIYWTGATLVTPTPPLITATQAASGAVTNITANSNYVSVVGQWTNTNAGASTPPTPPNVQNNQSNTAPPNRQNNQQNQPPNRQNQPPANPNGKKILIVGDSITVISKYTWSGIFQAQRKDLNIEILAKGGEQLTAWMKPNLEARLKTNKYDKVYIYGGVNDCYSGRKTPQILNALQSMVDTVRATGAEAVVVTGYDSEIDMGDNSTKPTRLVKTRAEMEKLLAEYRVFQKSINIIKNAIIVPKISLGVIGDGFHPSFAQAKRLYEHISKY